MAYSISVVGGDRERIAGGRDRTCPTRIEVVIEAGNVPVAAAVPPLGALELELPQAAADRARAAAATRAAARRERYRMIILRRVVEDEVRPLRRRTRHRNEPPFLRGQVVGAGQASGLIPRVANTVSQTPWREHRGHHRCGTAPDSHRLRWALRHPGPSPGHGYLTAGGPGQPFPPRWLHAGPDALPHRGCVHGQGRASACSSALSAGLFAVAEDAPPDS